MAQEEKILIIDDDSSIGDMMKLVLEFNGYDVIVSEKPGEAEDIILTHHIDLIILDMLISGINGTDVCKRLRENKNVKISKTPILMMSALHDAGKKCKKAGANDFLAKPFEVDDLLVKVREQVE